MANKIAQPGLPSVRGRSIREVAEDTEAQARRGPQVIEGKKAARQAWGKDEQGRDCLCYLVRDPRTGQEVEADAEIVNGKLRLRVP